MRPEDEESDGVLKKSYEQREQTMEGQNRFHGNGGCHV